MIAIETKFLGPTNYRGSRIKAYTESGLSLTLSYDHSLRQGVEAHAPAALALAARMGWTGDLIGAGTSTGYVFVFADSDRFQSIITPADLERAQEARDARYAAPVNA